MARQAETRSSNLADKGSIIAVAMAVMNVATYGFTIVAARMLGPQEYGAFAALMARCSCSACSPSACRPPPPGGSRPTRPRRPDRGGDPAGHLPCRARCSAAVLLALTPVINVALRLDSLPTAALVGVTACR